MLILKLICYGLRTDFNTNLFEGSQRLLEIAHKIEEPKTICACERKAIFNVRLINDKYVFEGDQVAIDGDKSVTYESLCPKCYYTIRDKYKKRKNNFFLFYFLTSI